MDISRIVRSILTKNLSLEDALKKCNIDDVQEIEATIGVIKEKLNKTMPNLGVDAGAGAGTPDTVVKFDKNGQWSIEKAIKSGQTLNYKEIDDKERAKQKVKREESERKAHTIDYTDSKNPKAIPPKAEPKPSMPMKSPTPAISEKLRTESALDTIKRRQIQK